MEYNPVNLAQLEAFLKLLTAKDVTRERMADILASGVLADLLSPDANLYTRGAFRRALGLDPYRWTGVGYGKWLEKYRAWPGPEMHREIIRTILSGSLQGQYKAFYEHFDDGLFRGAVRCCDEIRSFKNRMCRLGMISKEAATGDHEILVAELVEYLYVYHLLAIFTKKEGEMDYRHINAMTPAFEGSEAIVREKKIRWLKTRQEEKGFPDAVLSRILKQLNLAAV